MPDPVKVTVLLADEDSLRRDGLAAVLSDAANYQVVAKVSDGASAMEQIRQLRPDVAVVDLNLPAIHGIELIRRIRAEALRTRVVIMAGTSDDEIIREVVRAGGDGYLLKNGPARHLIDAINYVRDGGQYFSPQLRRDGLDRRLLEEPRRQYSSPPDVTATVAPPAGGQSAAPRARPADDPGDENEYEEAEERPARPLRASRPKSRTAAGRRGVAPAHLRERMRDEAGASDLGDRDYEIMSMMADGIKPILDRLEEIDNRVALMEVGDAPVPSNPRDWLNLELANTLRGGETAMAGRTAYELEARLPEMIEEAVTKRFNQMAGKLQQEIEETHVRTLETFVKNIQVKLVQRVSALEQDMSKQAESMQQLREYSQRTEDNLSRLISGVDKLAQDLPRRLASVAAENAASESYRAPAQPPPPRTMKKRVPVGRRMPRVAWAIAGGILFLGGGIWGISRFTGRPKSNVTSSNSPAAKSDSPRLKPPAADADTTVKMQAAQQYVDQKDYPMAEDLYKQVLSSEPKNAAAIQALASVLYREDKVDEAAAMLDRLEK